MLDATADQVLDDAVRVTLSDELASAEALAPTAVDAVLAVVEQTQLRTASAADLSQRADALDTARQAAVDAQVAWQADQDRVAAEQAAEAAQAAEDARRARDRSATNRPSPPAPSKSDGSTKQPPKNDDDAKAPATGGKPSAPAPSAPAPAPVPGPAPVPDQGGWVESGSDTWCDSFDTSGAEGSGGWC